MYYIKVENEQESRVIQGVLFTFDYTFNGTKTFQKLPKDNISFSFDLDCKILRYDNTIYGTDTQICSIKELIKLLQNPLPSIKIGDNRVVFNKDGSIRVGCQDISFSLVKQIYEKANKLAVENF